MSEIVGDTPLTRFLAGQTLAQLRLIRSEYRDEIESLRTRMAGLEAELPLVEQAISEKTGSRRKRPSKILPGTTSVNGQTVAVPHNQPGLRQAVLAVMQTRAGTWTKQELFDALRQRRLAPQGKNPKNTLGNRLLEMERRGEIKRAGRGAYELAAEAASPGSGRNQLLIGSSTREAENDSR